MSADQDRLLARFGVPAAEVPGGPAGRRLFPIAERLAIVVADGCDDCEGCGPFDVGLAILDGNRLVNLGTVGSVEQLETAILSHPDLDDEQAGRLLADYRAARP